MTEKYQYIANDLEETEIFAKAFSVAVNRSISKEDSRRKTIVIAINGALGAGKTTFVSYLCRRLQIAECEISSPTFSLQNRYRGIHNVNHFDFYRIQSEDELIEIGFEETIAEPGIHIVEWSEKFPDVFPANRIEIQMMTIGKTERSFDVDASNVFIAVLADQLIEANRFP